MTLEQIVILLVFLGVFVGIILEKVDKTVIVLVASLGLIAFNTINFEAAIHAIDFDTICLLLGMMILVESIREVGIFDWLSVKLGLLTRGSPVLIFLLIGFATAVFSAFLDNVTTVLIMAPLMISLTKSIGLPPKIFILSVIFFSNIGGAATLIGDPPNILIGSQVPTLSFSDFLRFLSAPVIVSILCIFGYFLLRRSDLISSRSKNFSWLFLSQLMLEDLKRQDEAISISAPVATKAALVFGCVIAGFFTHAITHIEPAVIAMVGASVMLFAFHKEIDLHHLFAKLEWPTLIFFAGLFIIVGAMEHVGLLEMLAEGLTSLTSNLLVLLMIVLWSSAVLSALVDNIPFVAVMIPILQDLMAEPHFAAEPKIGLLWWALALGACFGGNGSMIGASANVVTCAIANSRGVRIGFREFLIEAFPVTLITVLISSAYLTLLYYW